MSKSSWQLRRVCWQHSSFGAQIPSFLQRDLCDTSYVPFLSYSQSLQFQLALYYWNEYYNYLIKFHKIKTPVQVWLKFRMHKLFAVRWHLWYWVFLFTDKITADGDCSYEIKRHLLLGRKAMTNLDSILKSRDITLMANVHLVKAMVFPIVMWELDHKEGWGPKNWCFWTVVMDKTLESSLDCKEIKPVIPKEINPEYSLEGLMLKLQYFGHLMRRTESLEKTLCWERLMAGGEGDDRGQDGWMVSLTQWTWVWASSRRWWRTRSPGMLQSMESQRVRRNWETEQKFIDYGLNYLSLLLCLAIIFYNIFQNDLVYHLLGLFLDISVFAPVLLWLLLLH